MMGRQMGSSGALAATLVFLAGISGCDGCTDTPSVPFAMGGSAAPSAPPSAVPPPSGSFQADATEPSDPGKIALGGRPIAAPEGRTFAAVLLGDGDADGTEDAFAWAKDEGGGGELLFYAGKERGESKVVLHVEKSRLGCTTTAHLRRLGRETVTIDVKTACSGDAAASHPCPSAPRGASAAERDAGAGPRDGRRSDCGGKDTSRIVVVHLPEGRAHGALPEARLVVDQRTSPSGERLDVSLTAEDRDGDGREDLVFRAKLEGAPAPMPHDGSAEAILVAIDRPAGYTLDPSEPEATLERASAELVRRAAIVAEAPALPAAVASLIRLQTSLCGDLGAALVSTTAGAIRCGDGRATVDALVAEAIAAITTKDLPHAFATAEIIAALGDRKSAHVKKLLRDLEKLAPTTGVRVLGRVPIERTPSATSSTPPFAFDADGHLVVIRGSDVVRVGADGVAVPTDAVTWPRGISWSSHGEAASLSAVVRRCGPAALIATVEREGTRTDVVLPALGPLVAPGLWVEPCTAGRVDVGVLSLGADRALFARGASLFVLRADGDAIVAAGAQPPLASEAPAPPGGARSADGTTSVYLTGRDAIVIGPTGARRWRAPEIASASACTPRSSGDQLACVGAQAVVLLGTPR